MLHKTLIYLVVFFGLSNLLYAQSQYTSAIYLQNADAVSFKGAVFLLKSQDGLIRINHQSMEGKEQPSVIRFTYSDESSRLGAMQLLINNGLEPYIYGSIIPADFPQPMNNGSKEDRIEYEAAKQSWIENNPERYNEFNQQQTILVIPQAEFDLMPAEKQAAILANPDLYSVQ